MFIHAIFNVALDVQLALGLQVRAGIGLRVFFIDPYGHVLNKKQGTVQSFLVIDHRLHNMEASSGIP